MLTARKLFAPACMVAVLLASSSIPAQALEITSSKAGAHGYTIRIDNDEAIVEADARAAIALTAYQACGYEEPELGEFVSAETATSFRYTQKVTCPKPVAVDEPLPEVLTEEEKQAVKEEVSQLTDEHFHLTDAGRYEVALRDLDGNSFRKNEWQASREAFAAVAGRMLDFHITKVEIEEIPSLSLVPEIAVTVSFRNRYERVAIECGMFTWARAPSGGFRVVDAGQTYITSERFARLSKLEQAVLDIRMGCRRD